MKEVWYDSDFCIPAQEGCWVHSKTVKVEVGGKTCLGHYDYQFGGWELSDPLVLDGHGPLLWSPIAEGDSDEG
jgi:hypothetical protein